MAQLHWRALPADVVMQPSHLLLLLLLLLCGRCCSYDPAPADGWEEAEEADVLLLAPRECAARTTPAMC